MDPLTQYILAAMLSWVPLSSQAFNGENEAETRARYESIAADIAAGAQDPDEPPIFRATSHELEQAKMALELASISSFEGGYQKFVDEGVCNQGGYKADRRGGCDGGHAWTIWQMHTMGGLFLLPNGGLTSMDTLRVSGNTTYAKEHADELITGPMLIANRRLAAKVALRMIRISYHSFDSLCGYTGENDHRACASDHHLADLRHGRAVAYLRVHPYVPSSFTQLVAID